MESFLSEVESVLNESIILTKKLSMDEKATWYIKTTENHYIFKMAIEEVGFWMKILESVYGRCIYFQNEYLAYKALSKSELKNFQIPQLLETDKNRYIILAYYDFQPITEIDNYEKMIFNAVSEFNLIPFGFKQPLALKLIRRIPYKLTRWLITRGPRYFGLKQTMLCLRVLIKSSMKQSSFKQGLYMHDDLFGPSNIAFNKELGTMMYDFEGVLYERKWILSDAVDLCITTNSVEFHGTQLKPFVDEYLKRGYDLDVFSQVRVALMRKILRILFYFKIRNSKVIKGMWQNFLFDVVLNDKAFESWYQENVSKYLE